MADSPPVPLFEASNPIRKVTDTTTGSCEHTALRCTYSNLIKLHFYSDMTCHVANSDIVMTIYDEKG